MSTAIDRKAAYDKLHETAELRFPREDYPTFCSWLNVPAVGGLRLLDIACGQGFFLEAAETACPQLELDGLDFSATALARSRSRLTRTRLHEASATAMPFPDASFDYCVNLGSLEHFEDPAAAMREMHRVMKPTAKAMVIVPNQFYLGNIWRVVAYGETEEQEQEGMTTFRSAGEWTRLFRSCHLDVTGVTPYNGVHHLAWYFKRRDGAITEDERRWRATLDTFVKPFIPLELSQCFAFMIRRQQAAPDAADRGGAGTPRNPA